SSRRRHTRLQGDWSSDVCSSDLGLLTRENQTLDQKTTEFQNRIDSLDKLLADKRTRLERQFANMESILANLQTQQQAIGSLSTRSEERRVGKEGRSRGATDL